MKNPEQWRPTKYVVHNGHLRGSRNPKEVGLASRLITDMVAHCYDTYLVANAQGRLIDLGCGKAPMYGIGKDFVTEYFCADWANTFHPNPHLDLECNLNEPLPIADASFNTIILSDVLEHIEKPWQLWSEMARILAPGGKLLMNVPYFYWLHETPYDYYRYTEFALRKMAEAAGFKIHHLAPQGGVPEILADIIAKTTVNWSVIGKFLAGAAQKSCVLFTKTGFGKRFSVKTSRYFPLFYFLIAEKE